MPRGFLLLSLLFASAPVAGDEAGYKVLVFAPQAPVIVRVIVEFDAGVSIADNRRSYASQWFSRLDHDRSGQLDAQEAARTPSFGRFEDVRGEMEAEWTRLDTSPTDGQLSSAELLAHVEAAMGSGLSIRRPRRSATQSVVLHPRLDIDKDGQVSVDEVLTGLASLAAFDFDDDGTLSAAELQQFPRSMRAAASEALEAGQAPFVTLDSAAELPGIATRLIAQYGDADGIGAAALGFEQKTFAQFDGDDNGRLNRDELVSCLNSVPSDLTVTLHYPEKRLKKIEVDEVSRPAAVTIKEESARRLLQTQMGGLNVNAQLLDATSSFESITTRFRSTQFSIADRDRDERLNPEEFGRLEIENITFTAVDADRDKAVSKDEFLQFVELRALLARCRLEMTVSNENTSLFEVLDDDEDYRISPREFDKGAAPLKSLDQNGNGKLAESELVTQYTLSFALTRPPEFDDLVGSAGFNQMADETQLPIVRAVTGGPEWFRKMDRNQDGDVAWREFLGPRTSFDQLDTDGNGLIDRSEASP